MAEKNKTYYFHQTPKELAKDLVALCAIEKDDMVIEPFKGEGAFYDAFPEDCKKEWAEITEGKDWKEITRAFDWVITNPPFRFDLPGKRVNSFWVIVEYYAQRARKGMAFLCNDNCFTTLTPKRLAYLKELGWEITQIVCCAVKKWRGRYLFVIFEKKSPGFYKALQTNY